MSISILSRLEHSCIQPGLWLIEGHQVRRLPNRYTTQANPRGIRWVVIRLKGGNLPNDNRGGVTFPTFADAVDALADHVDKGCDCP